jgi:hypothetical protein
MNEVGKVGRASAITSRRVTSRGGFAVPEPGQDATLVQLATPVSAASLLSLQEVEDDPVQRDRMARAGGEAALDALRDLQLALLMDQDDPEACARLAALATLKPASDPKLAAIVRAIAVRAAVELARRQPPLPGAGPARPNMSGC